MAYDLTNGSVALNKLVIDSIVKQVAARSYKFKQAVAVETTDGWDNQFYREQTTVPAGQTGNATKGVPWGADFPQYSIGWDEVHARIVKHALEENIPWERILKSKIDIQARTLIRITEGVTKSVDDDIWNTLKAETLIQTYNVESNGHGAWDEASGAFIDDVFRGSRLIAEYNYDVGDLLFFISPKDKQAVMSYIVSKGAQFPSIASDVVRVGSIGRIANVTFIESVSVTASWAMLVKPKTCAIYKETVPLISNITEDPLKSIRIRVVEEGIVGVTDPKAIVAFYGTQSA